MQMLTILGRNSIDIKKNKNRIFKQKLFYYKFNLFCDRVNCMALEVVKKNT